jgi:hypothetical protein
MTFEIDLQGHQTTSNSARFAKLEADDNLKADVCLKVIYRTQFEFILFGEGIDREGENGVSERDKEMCSESSRCAEKNGRHGWWNSSEPLLE